MKKKSFIVIAVLLLLLVVFFWFRSTYIVLDSGIFRRDAAELDLRDTDLTVEEYERLTAALPGCQVHWLIPFQGESLDPESRHLRVQSITVEDMAALKYFPNLETIDMRACTDYEAILQVQKMYPDVEIAWLIPFQGNALESNSESLTVSHISDADVEMLKNFSNLKTIDARSCADLGSILQLQLEHPEYQILWTVAIGSHSFDQDTTALEIADADIPQLMERLRYLPHLETVTFTGNIPGNDNILELKTAYPEVTFIWDFPLCGVTVNSNDTEIDLSKIKMTSVDEVENSLKYFNRLERVVMCQCGIPSEEMDALWKRHPDIRFVWSVMIGTKWVRTDETTFMPWKLGFGRDGNPRMTNAHTKEMKYLVDVMCMDIGHMNITDLSFLNYMPNMEYLLLCSNFTDDISPLANLKKLRYLEMFQNSVTDLSPLAECTALEDLNITYNPFQDVTPLLELENLQNIWISGWMIPEDQLKMLHEAFPDAKIVDDSTRSTAEGWRDLPNYFAQRDLFGLWYMTTP